MLFTIFLLFFYEEYYVSLFLFLSNINTFLYVWSVISKNDFQYIIYQNSVFILRIIKRNDSNPLRKFQFICRLWPTDLFIDQSIGALCHSAGKLSISKICTTDRWIAICHPSRNFEVCIDFRNRKLPKFLKFVEFEWRVD